VSLILDALHRSREHTNPVPGLATHHPVAQLPVERRQLLVWITLGVALVVIAWLAMDRFSAPPAPAADIGAPVAELSNNVGSAVNSITTELKARAGTAASTAAVAPAPPAPSTPVAEPAAPAAPAASSAPVPAQQATTHADRVAPEPATSVLSTQESDAVAELYRNRELQKDPVKPTPKPRPAPQTESRPADGGARNTAVDTSAAARAKKDADIDKILHQAREELENTSLSENSVPFLASLSQQTKDEIPTIYYQRHDYSSDPKQSSVVLNGAPVKVGGSPLPGMKVEEILPDSVVLNYRGTQFRLRALNSWVNL
jgi:general secretion pathway protein B